MSGSTVPIFTMKYEECEMQGSNCNVAEVSSVIGRDAMLLGE
jgi:hypothetical protein